MRGAGLAVRVPEAELTELFLWTMASRLSGVISLNRQHISGMWLSPQRFPIMHAPSSLARHGIEPATAQALCSLQWTGFATSAPRLGPCRTCGMFPVCPPDSYSETDPPRGQQTEKHIQLIQGDMVAHCAPAFRCVEEVAHSPVVQEHPLVAGGLLCLESA
jgi:hypothetical protein